jgi:DNA polymerase-3 subunit delta'
MVERLFYSAAPKLLKILEEPPEKTLFLLVAENQDLILNTIKSRTQLVKVLPYPQNELKDILVEQYGVLSEKANAIAIRAEGNLRKAIVLAMQDDFGAENFILFRSWLRGCFKASITEINHAITQFSSGNREQTIRFLHYAQELIRDAMLVNRGAQELTFRTGEEQEFLQNVAPYIHPDVLPGFYEQLNEAIFQIGRYGNVNIILTDLSFKMSNFLHTPKRNT